MSEEIVKYQASDGSTVELSPEVVKRYIITRDQNVDEREIFAFIAKCQARHLNPLAGDAYMTAYYDKNHGRYVSSVIVSKDYFVRTATQQPGFDGMRAGVVVANRTTGALTYREGTIVGHNTEVLVGGWAEVYDRSRKYPSRAEVSLEEYDQRRSLWLSKPATMIRKVALVQALREAYPGAYGGIYDSAEMPEHDEPEIARETPPEPVSGQIEPIDVSEPEQPEEEPQNGSQYVEDFAEEDYDF